MAGEFTGNLTCRERLEAHASGRINGRVETFRLMLHEGASVEGEMHMLAEAPRDASTTIRGSAPLRGEDGTESKADPASLTATAPSSAAGHGAHGHQAGSRRHALIRRQGGSASAQVRRGGHARRATRVHRARSPGGRHGEPSACRHGAAPGPDGRARRDAARSPRRCAWRRSSWRLAP